MEKWERKRGENRDGSGFLCFGWQRKIKIDPVRSKLPKTISTPLVWTSNGVDQMVYSIR